MDFEKKLQEQLDKLPYEKHVDGGLYNDGQIDGFEQGARWALALFNAAQEDEVKCQLFMSDPALTSATICRFCGKEFSEH